MNFSREQTASIGRTTSVTSFPPPGLPSRSCLTGKTHPSRGTCHPGKSQCPPRAPHRRRFSTMGLTEKQCFNRQTRRDTQIVFKNVEMPIIKNQVPQIRRRKSCPDVSLSQQERNSSHPASDRTRPLHLGRVPPAPQAGQIYPTCPDPADVVFVASGTTDFKDTINQRLPVLYGSRLWHMSQCECATGKHPRNPCITFPTTEKGMQ